MQSMNTPASIDELVARTQALASVPSIYFKVRDLIEQPDSSVVDLARIIAVDPALTARLLRLVNSPLYAQSRPVETVSRAVNMLGMQQIHDLVLVASLHTTFASFDTIAAEMRAFWEASVRRAALISALVSFDKERLFVLGLLGDLGLPVLLLHQPELFRLASMRAVEAGQSVHAAEQSLMGFDHAELGGALLAAWKLPVTIHAPIACQCRFSQAGSFVHEAAMLRLVGLMVEAVDRGQDPLAWVDAPLWAAARSTPEAALAALGGIEADVNAIRAAFFG